MCAASVISASEPAANPTTTSASMKPTINASAPLSNFRSAVPLTAWPCPWPCPASAISALRVDGVGVLGVRDREVDQHPHVRVVEPVERVPAVPPYGDHAVRAEQPQRMRGRRLAEAGDRRQIADTELTVEQCDQQLQPPRITEQTEDVGGVDDVVLGRHPRVHARDALGIDEPDRALVQALHICRTVHMSRLTHEGTR